MTITAVIASVQIEYGAYGREWQAQRAQSVEILRDHAIARARLDEAPTLAPALAIELRRDRG